MCRPTQAPKGTISLNGCLGVSRQVLEFADTVPASVPIVNTFSRPNHKRPTGNTHPISISPTHYPQPPPKKWISFANRTLRHFLAGTHQDQRPNLGGFLQIQALLNGGGTF